MARTMSAQIVRANPSGLSYIAKIPVAQRRMHNALSLTHPEIVIPRSWTKLDGPTDNPGSKPVLDENGYATVDLRAATGKIPHSAVAGPRAEAIVEAAALARQCGAISLVATDGKPGAFRCAAEAADTPEGREYIGKVAGLNPDFGYRVIVSPRPIDWRNFRETGAKNRVIETDQVTPELLDLENAGWSAHEVYDVCPKPEAKAPKVEVPAAEPPAPEAPMIDVSPEDAEEAAMAARIVAQGGAAGSAPGIDNSHAM